MKHTNIIIGAGITGITIAERLAARGEEVLIIEKRAHLGGNCYDYHDEYGILIQKYGPHIFHTPNEEVFSYLSQFTEWIDYKHKVLAKFKNKLYPVPINLSTINLFFGKNMNSAEAQQFLDSKKEKKAEIQNSRDVVVTKVGWELYDAFIKDYTFKQWDCYPEELDPEVLQRLPVRFDFNDLYFNDNYQGMPKEGFTQMFLKMVANEKIKIIHNTNYKDILPKLEFSRLFVTSPVDEFFDYRFGHLPYRSIRFEMETINQEHFQENSVINYTEKEPAFTRIAEFKKLTGQKHPKTTICKEYPSWQGEPTYPVPKKSSKELYEKYKAEVAQLKNIFFVGRLGEYKYINIDKAVELALNLVHSLELKQ